MKALPLKYFKSCSKRKLFPQWLTIQTKPVIFGMVAFFFLTTAHFVILLSSMAISGCVVQPLELWGMQRAVYNSRASLWTTHSVAHCLLCHNKEKKIPWKFTITGRIASEEVVSEKGGTHIFKSMHHLLPGLCCIWVYLFTDARTLSQILWTTCRYAQAAVYCTTRQIRTTVIQTATKN